MTYDEIVEEYRWKFRPHTEAELAWFRGQPSLRAALRAAAFAVKANGKRYSHQRWLKDETAQMALDVMLAHEREIAAAPDFDALHALLTRLLAGVPGAREMYVYDAAFRIGAKLGKLPSRVYLHRGTRDGEVSRVRSGARVHRDERDAGAASGTEGLRGRRRAVPVQGGVGQCRESSPHDARRASSP